MAKQPDRGGTHGDTVWSHGHASLVRAVLHMSQHIRRALARHCAPWLRLSGSPLLDSPTLPYEPVLCKSCRAALNPYCQCDYYAKARLGGWQDVVWSLSNSFSGLDVPLLLLAQPLPSALRRDLRLESPWCAGDRAPGEAFAESDSQPSFSRSTAVWSTACRLSCSLARRRFSSLSMWHNRRRRCETL